jgi:ComF family protein
VVYGGTARRLVLGLKHGDRHDIARPAARWMARATREIVMPDMLVVPVPLHIHRHLVRRFNQAALLAKALAEELSLDWCPDALHRHAPTRSLKGQSSEQRHATLAGQISVPPKRSALFEDRPVLLVDDVLTTGATLGACAEACLAEGASVVCVSVLARVAKDT